MNKNPNKNKINGQHLNTATDNSDLFSSLRLITAPDI